MTDGNPHPTAAPREGCPARSTAACPGPADGAVTAMPRTAESPAVNDKELTALALRAGSGDRAGAEAFVKATHPEVWRFVARLTDPGSADDLTQETFLRALGSLSRFAGRSSARTWLLSIARRVVVDRHRRSASQPRGVALADWREAAEHKDALWPEPGFEDAVALADLLDAVPAERREAFVLTQMVGLSYEEAAGIAGCPVGTVRSRVARARRQLADLLGVA